MAMWLSLDTGIAGNIRRTILFESSCCIEDDTNSNNDSSFANTDLEYQLRQRDITHIVLAGLTTNTCVESTARAAREM